MSWNIKPLKLWKMFRSISDKSLPCCLCCLVERSNSPVRDTLLPLCQAGLRFAMRKMLVFSMEVNRLLLMIHDTHSNMNSIQYVYVKCLILKSWRRAILSFLQESNSQWRRKPTHQASLVFVLWTLRDLGSLFALMSMFSGLKKLLYPLYCNVSIVNV